MTTLDDLLHYRLGNMLTSAQKRMGPIELNLPGATFAQPFVYRLACRQRGATTTICHRIPAG